MKRCLEEIKYFQHRNQEWCASDRDWLLEDYDELSNQNSNRSQIWLHVARILINKSKKNWRSGTNCREKSEFYPQYSTCIVILKTPEFEPEEVYPPESER